MHYPKILEQQNIPEEDLAVISCEGPGSIPLREIFSKCFYYGLGLTTAVLVDLVEVNL